MCSGRNSRRNMMGEFVGMIVEAEIGREVGGSSIEHPLLRKVVAEMGHEDVRADNDEK